MRKFAVFDIDGTVARTSLYLASLHTMKRRRMLPLDDVQHIESTLEAWLKRENDTAFDTYSRACIDVYERVLPDLKLSDYESICDEVINKFGHKIYRYTTELIKELKAKGYLIFAVSGSEHSLVERFSRIHGFDDCVGNPYSHNGEYFTGEVGTTFRDKRVHIEALMKKHGASIDGSIGVGDTHGDIEMLAFVTSPIAFNPNQILYEHAKQNSWKIVVERKNVVYELEKEKTSYKLL